MHPEMIKAVLRIKGFTLTQIAKELDLSKASVSSVVKRRGRSRRIEAAICQKLGKPISEVFPDRYVG